jgi:hypothetical protein
MNTAVVRITCDRRELAVVVAIAAAVLALLTVHDVLDTVHQTRRRDEMAPR